MKSKYQERVDATNACARVLVGLDDDQKDRVLGALINLFGADYPDDDPGEPLPRPILRPVE